MSRPAQLSIGSGEEAIGLEYVKSRRVLRVQPAGAPGRGGRRPRRPRGEREVPLHLVFDRLGIDAAELAPAAHYLLFAAPAGRPRGGTGDLVRVFTCEETARAAFRAVRLQSGGQGWAELAALDAAGRLRRLCWFAPDPAGAERWPPRSRRRRRDPDQVA